MTKKTTIDGTSTLSDSALSTLLSGLSAARGNSRAATAIREAAKRLSCKGEAEPTFTLVEVRQVCSDGPSIWEAVDEDDDSVFFRYTRGVLTAFADDALVEYVRPDLPDPERMDSGVLESLMRHLFRFPRKKPVSLLKVTGRKSVRR